MSTLAATGFIETRDVDLLVQVVRPWDVILRQMAPGRLHSRLDYLQVNGILLYREHWSHRILATGATPAGYFFFGGPVADARAVGWCGTQISTECLAFGRPGAEVDFATPNDETHICILVPEVLLLDYLGAEAAERLLPKGRYLSCDRGCGTQLLRQMQRMLEKYLHHDALLANAQLCKAIEWQLLGGLVEFLLTSVDAVHCSAPSVRHNAVLRAVRVCDQATHALTAGELSAAAGVSLRVLEMGFAEFLQITPRQFIRWNRMNRARRALSASCSQAASVTMIAGALGVNELGRFAVEYKNLFGESPSVTLRRDSGPPLERITELLAGTG